MKLILLHGWNQNKNIWDTIISKLTNFSVIALDLPGFGIENLVNENWGVEEYSRWAVQKIEKLIRENEEVILLGHSFGGRIATKIASERPTWLHGLILSGSPSIYRPKLSTKMKINIFKLLKVFIPHFLKVKLLPKELKKAYLNGMDTIFRNVVTYDQTKALSKINVPTLLIWGVNDLEVPLHIPNEMTAKIKLSDLKIIDNAGHNSFIDNPDLFVGYVKKFIKKIN